MVQSFPMDGMPEEVRKKFTERLTLELRVGREGESAGRRREAGDRGRGRGTVMATVTP